MQPAVHNEKIPTALPPVFTAPNQTANAVAYAFRDKAQLHDGYVVISDQALRFPTGITHNAGTLFQVLDDDGRIYIVFDKKTMMWVSKEQFKGHGQQWPLTWDSVNHRLSARRSTFLGDYFDYFVAYSFVWYPGVQIALIVFVTLWSALAVVGCFDDPAAAGDTARSARNFMIGLTVYLLVVAGYGHAHLNDLAAFDWLNESWSRSFAPFSYINSKHEWEFAPAYGFGSIKHHSDIYGRRLISIHVVAALLLLVPSIVVGLYFLATSKKFVIGLYYVFTSHPATDVVRRSKGTASDHIALTAALSRPPLGEPEVPPPPLRSRVLRRKAEAFTEFIKRRQAERGLLQEHEDFVRREHRRKQERQ